VIADPPTFRFQGWLGPRHGRSGNAVRAPGAVAAAENHDHAEHVPGVASLDALHKAVAEFVVADLGLAIEPSALAAAQRSLDESGLLLLGEMHGVRENPLLIRALMQALGLRSLALEWFDFLTPVIRAFLSSGTLTDHESLWSGDGRITAGHLTVLAERATAGPVDLILFDGVMDAGWSWSQHDEAMAARILAGAAPGARTLVVAGNAHTPTTSTVLGVPLGAHLARRRPGIREIRICYGSGRFYNLRPRRMGPSLSRRPRQVTLYEHGGELVLDLPVACEAVVPHRSLRIMREAASGHQGTGATTRGSAGEVNWPPVPASPPPSVGQTRDLPRGDGAVSRRPSVPARSNR
jgi:hypothetical protein